CPRPPRSTPGSHAAPRCGQRWRDGRPGSCRETGADFQKAWRNLAGCRAGCLSLRRDRTMLETHTEMPMAETAVALSPETVLAQMKQNGVTDIIWLPDSETNWLYLLMQTEPSLRLVGVSREGHACSIAAGLFAGGRKPM